MAITHDTQVPSSAQETKLCPVFRDPRLETRDHSQLTTHDSKLYPPTDSRLFPLLFAAAMASG